MADASPSPASAGLWAALIFLWFVASVLYRKAVGRPIWARRSPGDVFVERWASGRFGSGLLARLSTARNCLQVQVDREHLRIHPHFPFTLGFVPEVYGMDHVVRLDTVRSVTIMGGRHAQTVEVMIQAADGRQQTFLLLLRNAEGFIRAVHAPRHSG